MTRFRTTSPQTSSSSTSFSSLTSSSSSSSSSWRSTLMRLTIVVTAVISSSSFSSSASLTSSPRVTEDPNQSFTYFSQIADPNARQYESPVNYENPYFFRMYFFTNNMGVKNLYVTALDYLYKLDPSNISHELNIRVNLTAAPDYKSILAAAQPTCQERHMRKPNYTCRNFVQAVFKTSSTSGQLVTCSSGAAQSQEFIVNENDLQVVQVTKNPNSASGRCPGVPFTNFTSLFAGDSYFSGVPTENDLKYVFRKTTISQSGDSTFLETESQTTSDNIGYEASFDIDKFVYIFFHELPEEIQLPGESGHFARVGRVCKNDPGSFYKPERFMTFVKIRLICKLTTYWGEDFYNRLRDVQYDGDTNTFHILFTDDRETSSALCSYLRSGIDSFFSTEPLSGLKNDLPSCWVVQDSAPSLPKPCDCSSNNFDGLPISTLRYCTTYNLVLQLASPTTPQPIFTHSRISYRRFVAEKLAESKWIYWLYSPDEPEFLTRLYAWRVNMTNWASRRIVKVRLSGKAQRVSKLWDLKLESVNGTTYVFASTEKLIVQLNLEMCQGHARCTTCVTDPHCAWNAGQAKCVAYNKEDFQRNSSNFKYGPETNSTLGLCNDICTSNPQMKMVISGSNTVLDCLSPCSPDDGSSPVWYHLGSPVLQDAAGDVGFTGPDDNTRMIGSENYNLYILNATFSFNGTYECRDSKSTIVFSRSYLKVTKFCKLESNFESTWRREFQHWCWSYEDYANSLQGWKCDICKNPKCSEVCNVT